MNMSAEYMTLGKLKDCKFRYQLDVAILIPHELYLTN
jgi:hypothetical protein